MADNLSDREETRRKIEELKARFGVSPEEVKPPEPPKSPEKKVVPKQAPPVRDISKPKTEENQVKTNIKPTGTPIPVIEKNEPPSAKSTENTSSVKFIAPKLVTQKPQEKPKEPVQEKEKISSEKVAVPPKTEAPKTIKKESKPLINKEKKEAAKKDQNPETVKKRKKRKKGLLVGIILLVLLIVVIVLHNYTSKKAWGEQEEVYTESADENSQEEMTNDAENQEDNSKIASADENRAYSAMGKTNYKGKFFIGVKAIKSEEKAKAEVERLLVLGYKNPDYYYIPNYVKGGSELYRVVLGPYDDLASATDDLPKIKVIVRQAYIDKIAE